MIKILIPTYNEAGNIKDIIFQIRETVPDASVLVIDDNSPDGTGRLVSTISGQDARVELYSRMNKEGLGKAYVAGFKKALQDTEVTHIIMMDADFSHDPSYLPELISKSAEYDLVIGSRYILGGETEGWEEWRKKLSSVGNRYTRFITRMSFYDLTAGFNIISVRSLRKVDLEKIDSSGYAFQIELKYLLWKSGATVAEIPILFKNRREGESKLSGHIVSEGLLAPWKLILRNR